MKRWVQERTIKVAADSKYKLFRHGAVLEKGGSIISQGTNSLKPEAPQDYRENNHSNHSRKQKNSSPFSVHAEVAAIIKARGLTQGCTLYVARVTNTRITLSKPCKTCQVSIIAAGIRKVVYSIDNYTWGEMRL